MHPLALYLAALLIWCICVIPLSDAVVTFLIVALIGAAPITLAAYGFGVFG